jgi:DNA invertase Pin-like site-specific DNA recombinase
MQWLRDLQNILHDLKIRGITLKATEQPIDTSTAAGKAVLDILGVSSEFATNLRRERQLEGIAEARVSRITLLDGLLIAEFNGLPTFASRVL